MEAERNDALEARDRCMEAIVGADQETGQALWRAMARYHWKGREASSQPMADAFRVRG